MYAEVSPHFRAWMTGKRTESQALKVRNTQSTGCSPVSKPETGTLALTGRNMFATPNTDRKEYAARSREKQASSREIQLFNSIF
ncbi:hypothetical protein SAMN04488057_12621 [Cyclobacterium lianum]|uniref:Uncharacterized protein n=1 Tax=Cyclobacterium lianum TaxID=388280 RepID=A0A1M7QU62_9BACT|nr:hypothetical protein SAMN04488057_12621 [Cyclobacterium lianum]